LVAACQLGKSVPNLCGVGRFSSHLGNRAHQKIKQSGKSIEDQAVAIDAANTKFGEQSEWIGQIQRDTGSAAAKAAAYRDAMGQANTNAGKVRDTVAQIKDRSITIGVNVNNAGFESWWRTVQNRAAQGITVNMRPGQGRAWE